MRRIRSRSATKLAALKSNSSRISWLFVSCSVLMFASLIPMWSHWSELAEVLGFEQATGALASVTAATAVFAWWLNTGDP